MMNPVRDTQKLTQTQTLPSTGVYSHRALDRQNNCNTTEKTFNIWNKYGYSLFTTKYGLSLDIWKWKKCWGARKRPEVLQIRSNHFSKDRARKPGGMNWEQERASLLIWLESRVGKEVVEIGIGKLITLTEYLERVERAPFSFTVWWETLWHPTPVLLPGKPHGRRSLVGCSPWGH